MTPTQFRGVRHAVAGALAIGLILVCCAQVLAQTTPPPPAAPATQPASVETTIREALPKLKDKSTGMEAVQQLQALRDEKVLRTFEHIKAKDIYKYKDEYVLAELKEDKKHYNLYDLFAAADEAGTLLDKPLATVAKEDVPESTALDVNRAVGRYVNDALRVLGLKINDPKVRRKAARDLGLRQMAESMQELQALAKGDPDAAVRREAEAACCMIVVGSEDKSVTPAMKVEAITRLGQLQYLPATEMLKDFGGKPTTTAEQKAALAGAFKSIDRHASITKWLQNLFSSISLGSIYVLLALGLAITFGLMGVINMAHGEMMMIGAVTTWACFEYIGKALPPAYFDWYYVIALPASFLTAATVGLIIEVTIVRWLYKRPLDSLLATIGVSYILIQAVRNWKGDNLGMRGPSWANGSCEILTDVLLPYNRLFLIALTIFCILSVILLFRYTKLGLMIRATVQNREMAQALGVNTRLVDMTTFAFGAGLAGLAGYGIVLTSNPTPEIGQTFIVKSFLTVVVGGVGKLAGVIVSGLGLGFIEKMLEPITIISSPIKIFDATWSQVAALVIVILFMQRKPAGLFPDKGRAADQADRISAPAVAKLGKRGDWMMGLAFIFVGLIVVPALYATGAMSLEYVNKLGYILTFAICAIGLDLVWGYIGVLSLTQFLFFAIGGYCMGLYLINYGPMDGQHHDIPRALYVVMSAVTGAKPPWFLAMFRSFPMMVFMGILLPALLALLIGLTTFRSRVRGVYFSILTQAITVAFWLIFQKNEMRLGGTNGLTNFTHILGRPIAGNDGGPFVQTRFWLYVASVITLMVAILIAKLLVNSGFGRVLVAIRDDETRLRFVGYQTWAYKAAAFTIAAVFASVGGMLYAPQKGIITPQQIAAGASILVVAWVAVGGRGSLWGAVLGAIFVSIFYEYMTSVAADYWYYALGGLFILVPLLLPGGLMSLPNLLGKLKGDRPDVPGAFEVITEATEAPAAGGH